MDADLSSEAGIAAFEQTPITAFGLPESTYDFLRDGAGADPDGIALEYFPDATAWSDHVQRYTFRQLFGRITQSANLFHSLGVRPDDVVSLMLPNIPESQFALWGAQAAGIANPINWMLESQSIAGLLHSAGTKVLVAYGGDSTIDIWDKVLDVVTRVPSIETVLRLAGDRHGRAPANVAFYDYPDVIQGFNANTLDSGRHISRSDIACYFPTGGTTSEPKLAIHTHGNEVTSSWLSAMVIALKQGEARLSASPLFHVIGVMSTSLATLARGGRLVMATASGWRSPGLVQNFWQIVEAYRLGVTPMIPTILGQLINEPGTPADISSLRVVTSGAAPLSKHVAHGFRALTGKDVCEGYGMTETTSVISMNPHAGTIKVGSVGLRFPYHSVRIISLDRRNGIRDVTPNEPGILAISGPSVISGYKGQDTATDLWIDKGWINTGDLMRQDADGYLWITGRVKDLIIRGGHNIDPKPVEEALFLHPDVMEAAVVGRPDKHAGEVPVAYVALRLGAAATADTLLNHTREHMTERAAIPKDCYVLNALPKTAIGKVLKNVLRADAVEKAFTAELLAAGVGEACKVIATDMGAMGIRCVVHIADATVRQTVEASLSRFTVTYEIQENDNVPTSTL